MIVDHPHTMRLQRDGTGALCIHGMMQTYHWVRISDSHVFCFGSLSPHHYHELHNHPQVSVLPVINSRKTLAQHLTDKGRLDHLQALRNWGLRDDFTTMDYLEWLEEQGMLGPQFVPEI